MRESSSAARSGRASVDSVSSVRTKVGATAFTRMPCGAHSRARVLVDLVEARLARRRRPTRSSIATVPACDDDDHDGRRGAVRDPAPAERRSQEERAAEVRGQHGIPVASAWSSTAAGGGVDPALLTSRSMSSRFGEVIERLPTSVRSSTIPAVPSRSPIALAAGLRCATCRTPWRRVRPAPRRSPHRDRASAPVTSARRPSRRYGGVLTRWRTRARTSSTSLLGTWRRARRPTARAPRTTRPAPPARRPRRAEHWMPGR